MFKKSLVTIAALGAFAGSAFAGVTLYGAVDGGFQYTYSKANKAADKKVSSFKLAEGIDASNSFGIKGEEKIADDLTVGFKLENGFNLANGEMKTSNVLFDREAVLFAKTVAGTVAVGREGAISSGFGMFGQFGGKVAAFGNGRGDVIGLQGVVGKYDRHDFSVTYQSPEFAGVKLLAQYANKGNTFKNAKNEDETKYQEGHGFFDTEKNDVFYAFGATYSDDQFYGTALVDVLDKHADGAKNGVKVSLGGNAKFDGFQVFAAGQYFKNVALHKAAISSDFSTSDVKGFGLDAGVAVPVATGSLKGNVGYMHAKQQANKDLKINRVVLGAVYDYPLSKRTTIYSGVGATFEKYKGVEEGKSTKGRAFAANFGLAHNF